MFSLWVWGVKHGDNPAARPRPNVQHHSRPEEGLSVEGHTTGYEGIFGLRCGFGGCAEGSDAAGVGFRV